MQNITCTFHREYAEKMWSIKQKSLSGFSVNSPNFIILEIWTLHLLHLVLSKELVNFGHFATYSRRLQNNISDFIKSAVRISMKLSNQGNGNGASGDTILKRHNTV